MKHTDIRLKSARLYFIPVALRVPLKFGRHTGTRSTCARACVRVEDSRGRTALGWGETPLSVGWVWPSSIPYEERNKALMGFCGILTSAWAGFACQGHPIEIGHAFMETELPKLLASMRIVVEPKIFVGH